MIKTKPNKQSACFISNESAIFSETLAGKHTLVYSTPQFTGSLNQKQSSQLLDSNPFLILIQTYSTIIDNLSAQNQSILAGLKQELASKDQLLASLHEQIACKEQELASKDKEIDNLKEMIKNHEAKIIELSEKANKPFKDSTNSGKPGSKEIGKRKKIEKTDGEKGKPGAKKGHKGHRRKKFDPNKAQHISCEPESTICPGCGQQMVHHPSHDRKKEQTELKNEPLEFKIITLKAYWCKNCKTWHFADIPPELAGGFLGPNLQTFLALLKGQGHVSISGLKDIVAGLGADVSRGEICKSINKLADILEEPYREIEKKLPSEPVVHSDETSHKERGHTLWTWVFRTPGFAFFKISVNRSSAVLEEVLGNSFKGILICDYHSAYRKFIKEHALIAQFCSAHLLRDAKYLADHIANKELMAYGEGLGKNILT
jgi:hypothetical protein